MKKLASMPDQLNLFTHINSPTPKEDKIAEILETRRERFQSRRDRRLENASDRAATNRRFATSYSTQSSQMAKCIPLGQPILVGHYSEGRDRRFRQRMRGAVDKSVEASKKAQYYEDKVASIESNTAIYSDDPNAIDKITERIAELVKQQEFWKAGNKIAKSKKLTEEQKIEQLEQGGHSLNILIPTYGRIGYPGYKLTNNNGNIKRLRDRLELLSRTLAKAAELGDTEQEYPELKLTVKQSRTINRLQLKFEGKPSKEIREMLGQNGFRFSPSDDKSWQRQLPESDFIERRIIEKISELSKPL
jgi:hypothetical protein